MYGSAVHQSQAESKSTSRISLLKYLSNLCRRQASSAADGMNGLNQHQLTIRSINGESFTVDAASNETASCLKRKIAEVRNIPLEAIILIKNGEIIEGNDNFSTPDSNSNELDQITMILTLDNLINQLNKTNDASTLKEVLGKLSNPIFKGKGNEAAIEAVTARLEDGHADAAIKALAQIVEKGDEAAIEAVTAQ